MSVFLQLCYFSSSLAWNRRVLLASFTKCHQQVWRTSGSDNIWPSLFFSENQSTFNFHFFIYKESNVSTVSFNVQKNTYENIFISLKYFKSYNTILTFVHVSLWCIVLVCLLIEVKKKKKKGTLQNILKLIWDSLFCLILHNVITKIIHCVTLSLNSLEQMFAPPR